MAFRRPFANAGATYLFIVFAVDNVLASSLYDDPYNDPSSPSAGSGSDWGTAPIIPSYYTKVRVAHAVLASTAWLIFFPVGAILVRTLETTRSIQIHYAVQLIGLYMFIAAAGMGIWMAKTGKVLSYYHPIIGITLLGCLAVQPATEVLNHFLFRTHPKVIYLGRLHIWFGRLIIIVGMIQGGLGFVFSASLPYAKPDPAPRIAYGVVAIIMWVLYVSLAIVWPEVKHTFGWWQRRYNSHGETEELRNRNLAEFTSPSAMNRPTETVWR